MKQLLFTVVALAGMLAIGADVKTTATKKADTKPAVKSECKAAECKVKTECKAKSEVKQLDQKIKSKGYNQMRLEREKKLAEKAGMSVEDFRAKIKAEKKEKRYAMYAKRLGMDVEEFKKLPEKERAKRLSEFYKQQREKKAAAAKIAPASETKKTEEK